MDRLHLHSVVKSFGNKKVLQGAALELTKGSVLGLFGRNGSGKSTLLQLLYGSLKADNISISIDDKKILPSEIIPKQLIGYCPQHSFLPKNLKVRDVIPLFHPSEEKQDMVFYDSHIATMTHKRVGNLSLGELKYFEVILLGHLPHPFLLLDEPFSMVEPLHKESLKHFLNAKQEEKGILITDHYYHDVLSISNENTVLKDGMLHKVATTADLQKFEYLTG
ncbi:ATP-binding cassette domain-containing protein [Rasiella rasia]|uniref:ATP-binding cassette domain-containing protein n=1 Tax=Rasiella rasia TaxID=2744027 RepID=A0A6G6GKE4_9FLAO|nr:ATP-binding cassette domain-containing protein [Rasiella rasia]QIE58161.1 ATP-binding cassette domain-containing protein [Rasiella rasia]